MNELMTEVIVKLPLASPGSANKEMNFITAFHHLSSKDFLIISVFYTYSNVIIKNLHSRKTFYGMEEI